MYKGWSIYEDRIRLAYYFDLARKTFKNLIGLRLKIKITWYNFKKRLFVFINLDILLRRHNYPYSN